MTLPPDLNPSGLQTWPLKNRIISTENVGKKTGSGTPHQDSPVSPPHIGNNVATPYSSTSTTSSHSSVSPISPHHFSPNYQHTSRETTQVLRPVQPATTRTYNTLPSKISKTTIDEVIVFKLTLGFALFVVTKASK